MNSEYVPPSFEGREDRLRYAEDLLEKTLVPAYHAGGLTSEIILELFHSHKRKNVGSGDDIEIVLLQAIILRKYPASFRAETDPLIDPYTNLMSMISALIYPQE